MENRKESRLAWKIWTVLDEFSSLLWNLYEKEFLQFCREDYIPDAEGNDGDEDNSIWGTESEFIVDQNKKRKV